MRLALVTKNGTPTVTFADEDGDGLDDETGLPVAEDPDPDEDPDEAEESDELDEEESTEEMSGGARHRWLLAIEGVETGDGRSFAPGALTWRDLPLPFMATDETSEAHQGARLVSNIVEIVRVGNEVQATTVDVESDDEKVLDLQRLIANGDLRGVSVDLDQIDGSMLISGEEEVIEREDGMIEIPMSMPKQEFSSARIMGATGVPFPAFAETQRLTDDALAAGAGVLSVDQLPLLADEAREALVASIDVPVAPPADWFSNPRLDAPTPLTVELSGRVFGHLALFDSCHIGFQDRCVTPPRSATNYDVFHSGAILTEDGSKVRVGQITVDCGHADLRASAPLAAEHYDNTGWAGADVAAGEDEYGIWIAGSLRPGLDAAQVRSFMGADVSGDWRRIKGNLELVGIASVNVPGFSKTQFESGDRVALVASIPICSDTTTADAEYLAIADRIASTVGLAKWQQDAQRERIALSVGAHPSQRRLALLERVQRESF